MPISGIIFKSIVVFVFVPFECQDVKGFFFQIPIMMLIFLIAFLNGNVWCAFPWYLYLPKLIS